MDSLDAPILQNLKTHEQVLPISLQSLESNSSLPQVPEMLKDFVNRYKHKKEIFDLQKGHIDDDNLDSNKMSFFSCYIIDIFLFFITALMSLIVSSIVIYIVYKHVKLKSLVISIALQPIKGMGTAFDQYRFNDIYCTCKIQ